MRFRDNCSTFADEMEIRNLIKSSGGRNFAKLLSANVVAQVIGLVVYPILTRMYAPEDFGLLNLFLSIAGVLVVLSTAEYYNAIVLPKQDSDGANLCYLSATILLGVVMLTTLSVFFSKPIAALFNMPDLANYYWMMPILVLALGGWNILNYWYIRREEYAFISRYQLSNSLFSAGGKLSLGYVGYFQGGMIYATVFAPAISLIIRLIRSRKGFGTFPRFSWNRVLDAARDYRNFPLFSLPRSFVNMVAGQLPVLLLTSLFGAEYVGWWSMAILLGFTPISVIIRSIYQVLYQYTTNRVNHHQPIHLYFRRFTGLVLACGIPFFALLGYFMPDLTLLVLGNGWEETGIYLRWMLPWVLCSLLTGSTGFLADIFFQQKIGLGFEILTAVLRTAGVVLGMVFHDFTLAIIGYSIGTALAVAAQYLWLMGLTRRYDASLSAANDAPTDGSENEGAL